VKKDRERERDGECELWAKKERGGHKNEIPGYVEPRDIHQDGVCRTDSSGRPGHDGVRREDRQDNSHKRPQQTGNLQRVAASKCG